MRNLPLYPGATLGVLGGGQLGRMFALEALRMGYRVWVLDPDPDSPAGAVASRHLLADYNDAQAVQAMGEGCDAVTVEFENIPAATVRALMTQTRVTPSAVCIETAQDRRLEKAFAVQAGLETPAYAPISSREDIPTAAVRTGFPAILKTVRLGYDGKGQYACQNIADVEAGFVALGEVVCVLEQRVELQRELSVVLARGDDHQVACFPVAENRHENGILDITVVPAAEAEEHLQLATDMATALAHALDYVGVMAVELFVAVDGRLLFNEMAPRPHNSGHFTQDATVTSQFEQQLRMLCGLPLGSVELIRPVAMLNLLGERWRRRCPNWSAVFVSADNRLHLYGKNTPRPGRKMGHVNLLRDSRGAALTAALALKAQL